jgi:hypothetical protein
MAGLYACDLDRTSLRAPYGDFLGVNRWPDDQWQVRALMPGNRRHLRAVRLLRFVRPHKSGGSG